MSGPPAAVLQPDDPPAIIAAFADWADLETTLAGMIPDKPSCYYAVPHARADAHPEVCRGATEMTGIEFTCTRTCFTRREGTLALALGRALGHGVHTLADALRRWVSQAQSEQLEDHVARGRLLLWVQPMTSEEVPRRLRASCPCQPARGRGSLSRKPQRQ